MEVTDPDLSPDDGATPGAATEEALGELHAAVANALTSVIRDGMPMLDKEGEEVRVPASAAHIGAAIAFLKNNNITASPSRNKDLAALKSTLAGKRKRKELNPRALDEAQETFERMQGSNGLMQ